MASEPPNNRCCQVCKLDQAEVVCYCSSVATLLCPRCIFVHQTKTSQDLHTICSIRTVNYPRYLQQFRLLESSSEALQQCLQRFEQAEREIEQAFEQMLATLRKQKDLYLAQLNTAKEQLAHTVESALREARKCLNEDLTPNTPLARAIWTRPLVHLQLFQYSLSVPDLDRLCSSWFNYHIDLQNLQGSDRQPSVFMHRRYLTQPLVYVESTHLNSFDGNRECWDSYPLNTDTGLDDGSRYVWTDSGLFCSGSIS